MASAYVEAVEAAIVTVRKAPERWPVVDSPEVRRFVLNRFPYVIYCRWEKDKDRVVIYAVMHGHRAPGYWKDRTFTK